MALTPKERKVQRDYLTRKKRTLQRQGASNAEIKAFMGGRWNFAGMSDKALERAYKEVKGKGRTQVFGNHVYTSDYVKKAKAWYGDKFSVEKLTQGFRRSQRSDLNRFHSAKEVKEYKSNRDLKAKERYIEALEDMYYNTRETGNKAQEKAFKSMISRIRRMSASNFGAFLTGGAADKVSFDSVMVFIETDDTKTAFEFQDSLARGILSNVDKFSKQFVSDMRRQNKRGKK